MDWISTKDRTPELLEGRNYSPNVFAWCNDELMVMSYVYINNDGWFWASANGDIYGHAELDDDYQPIHWMPLPEPPKS